VSPGPARWSGTSCSRLPGSCLFFATKEATTRVATGKLTMPVLLFYKERAGEIQRELLLKKYRETNPEDECSRKAAGTSERDESADG
jgi:hypothetical protein